MWELQRVIYCVKNVAEVFGSGAKLTYHNIGSGANLHMV